MARKTDHDVEKKRKNRYAYKYTEATQIWMEQKKVYPQKAHYFAIAAVVMREEEKKQ